MINNRQAGRRRGRGGQQQRPQGNSGRPDNGNRIDNRSRGNAAQLLEKYKALARDAQMSGDRVNTEYYLQFADHYFRVLAETRSRFEENRQPQQGGANTFQDEETEYDDDGAPIAADPSRQQNGNQNYQGDRQNNGNQQDRPERQNQDRHNQDRQGQDRQNQDRQNQDRQGQNRQDRQYNDRNDRADRGQQDDDRPRRQNGNGNGNNASYGNEGERYTRDDRGNRNDRNDNRGNDGRNNEGRGNEARGDRTERYQAEDVALAPTEAPVIEAAPIVTEEQPQEAPRRRGRPRREPVAEAPAAFDSAALPPSLNISAVVPDAAPANDAGDSEEAVEKPRRRRGRPPASEATNA